MFKAIPLREAAARIACAGCADVVMHASPDADTLGCALAVVAVINANGGDAAVVCSDKLPAYLEFLAEGVTVSGSLRDGAVRIAVDVASPTQLGRFAAEAGTFSLMIDHHGRGEAFADNIIVPDAAACGEIVFRIVEILAADGMRIPECVPTYIYAAISGDTGSFRFANTTPETHRIAAVLHEMGADTVRVAHALHAVKTPGAVAALRLGLVNMKILCNGRLAMTSATMSELRECGIAPGDFSEADEMRSVMGVYVGVSLRECEPGVWRASTRANVPVDCAAVCGIYGGGGHTGAAGCTIRAKTREEAEAMLEAPFRTAIEEYERGIG